jgi:hypothetical protein
LHLNCLLQKKLGYLIPVSETAGIKNHEIIIVFEKYQKHQVYSIIKMTSNKK